jgi:hypothetical protein
MAHRLANSRPEYLPALDDAVAAAVGGKKKPKDAPTDAAAKWQRITERLGVEQQRSAYRHSLGLEQQGSKRPAT